MPTLAYRGARGCSREGKGQPRILAGRAGLSGDGAREASRAWTRLLEGLLGQEMLPSTATVHALATLMIAADSGGHVG